MFLLSIKRGYGGLLLRDVVMLAAASITLALWHFTKQPVIAAYLTTLISAMGGYLTVVKAYEQPNTEAPSTWAMSGAAGLFAALSVGRLNLALLAYPFYIFFVNNAVLIAILLGTRRAR